MNQYRHDPAGGCGLIILLGMLAIATVVVALIVVFGV